MDSNFKIPCKNITRIQVETHTLCGVEFAINFSLYFCTKRTIF